MPSAMDSKVALSSESELASSRVRPATMRSNSSIFIRDCWCNHHFSVSACANWSASTVSKGFLRMSNPSR